MTEGVRAWWRKFSGAKSEIFFYCLILFVAGVFVGNFFVVSAFSIFCFCLVVMFGLLLCWRKQAVFIGLLLIFSFAAGIFRYEITYPDFARSDLIAHYNESRVEFYGRISRVEAAGSQKLTVVADHLRRGKANIPAKGKVMITQSLYPEYLPGDSVRVICELKAPGVINGFDYGRYLSKDGIYSVCSFADAARLEDGNSFLPARIIFVFRQYLAGRLNASISEPQVSLYRGVLLGDSRGLPDSYAAMFKNLGLTHIIAISGDHIAIIAAALLQLLMLSGLSRAKAFWPLAAIIGFYVLLVGAPASAVRAAIMALLAMYAQRIGRTGQIRFVLALAASVMIMINPKILLQDVGFQLSFMAVWGLAYISPLIERRIEPWPDIFRIKEILLATISAQIATLPLLLYYFGQFSPISLLANILILPLIPFLTVWGLMNLAVAAVCLPLSRIMGLASWLMASYWIDVSAILRRIPFGYFTIVNFDLAGLILLYALIFAGYAYYRRQSIRNISVSP